MPELDPALFELTLKEAADRFDFIAGASKMPKEDLEEALISVIGQLLVYKKMVAYLLKHINETTYKSISAS